MLAKCFLENPDMEKMGSSHTGQSSFNAHELKVSVVLLRVVLLVFSVTALVLMVLDRETGLFPLPFFGLPRPIFIKTTAKYKLITGLRFFLGAMGTVAGYTVVHLALNIKSICITRDSIVGKKATAWVSFVADTAIAYLSVSAAAVAAEIAYLAERGAPNVLWNKVCSYFRHYCLVFGASLVSSFLAALAAFGVAGVSAYHLFRLYGIQQQQQQQQQMVDASKHPAT